MSLTLNTLKNKKKNELKEIAQDLGLSTTGLRNELESLRNPELLSENEAPPRRSGRQRNLNNTNTRSRHSTNGDRSSSDDESLKSVENEIKQEMIISETIRSVTEIEEINLAETSSQQENQENQEISHIVGQPITTNLSFSLNVEKIKSYIPKLRTPQHHTYSPLVFSVAKYGIFLISNGNFDWVEDIHEFVPDNLIYTGAGAGVILSFYETILRK
ncbi:12693_t:CDS:2 [Entrophospora sp. SA101]|nr:3244_t:CDS:2 [Entrophospora sp. SA101]CAJ0758275.1 9856_t:CDS:2 [Entrophospora sp. SA101]CAJ0762477.1 12693_t:CDS:2 [Entrophospora sp. SA101]